MLVLHRKKGESIVLNDNIIITVSEISGDKVKLAIEAPKEITIMRSEIIIETDTNRKAENHEKLSEDELRSMIGISKK